MLYTHYILPSCASGLCHHLPGKVIAIYLLFSLFDLNYNGGLIAEGRGGLLKSGAERAEERASKFSFSVRQAVWPPFWRVLQHLPNPTYPWLPKTKTASQAATPAPTSLIIGPLSAVVKLLQRVMMLFP